MINCMILQGRLTRDPELTNTPSGVEVAKFTVAWSEKYKETESKCFLNCVAWRATAAFVSNYFKKGQEIVVQGKLTTREYTDKEGKNRTATEITCDQVSFCGSKSDNSGNRYNNNVVATQQATETAVNTGNLSDFEEAPDGGNPLPF